MSDMGGQGVSALTGSSNNGWQKGKYLYGVNDLGQTVISNNPVSYSNGSYGSFRQNANGTWTQRGGLSGVASILGSGTTGAAASGPSAMSLGAAAAQSAVDTARSGVSAVKSAVSNSAGHIQSADADLNSARASALGMNQDIAGVRDAASALGPYAALIGSMGQGLYDQGNALGDVGRSIVAGDSSAGGVLGLYINNLLGTNPDAYVSMGAQDVRSSYDNALSQLMRSATRSGISGSSGSLMQTRADLLRAAANAIASAKTRLRVQGMEDQRSALQGGLQTALAYSQQASADKNAGMQGVAQAAGIVEKQGGLFSTAGSMGQAQSSAFANIGGVEVSLGQLEVSNGKAVSDAIQNVTAAQEAMANFYAQFADTTQRTSAALNQWGGFDQVATTSKS